MYNLKTYNITTGKDVAIEKVANVIKVLRETLEYTSGTQEVIIEQELQWLAEVFYEAHPFIPTVGQCPCKELCMDVEHISEMVVIEREWGVRKTILALESMLAGIAMSNQLQNLLA